MRSNIASRSDQTEVVIILVVVVACFFVVFLRLVCIMHCLSQRGVQFCCYRSILFIGGLVRMGVGCSMRLGGDVGELKDVVHNGLVIFPRGCIRH